MSGFGIVRGFEDVWRPPVRPRRRTPEAVLSGLGAQPAFRAKLSRLVNRAPEVMVKVTGRTRGGDHLRAHLDYISRHGALEMDGPWGERLVGRREIRDVADDWAAMALVDSRRRANSPLSLSVVLSMPRGADALAVRDAARAWATSLFSDRFDYVLALHTDAGHPHVHVAVCARGFASERLNPKKADLEHWRQVFAEALRDRGVEAEATPRRARGVTRKAERTPLRKMRERHEAGRGPAARMQRSAYYEAAKAALGGRNEAGPWEHRLVERQRRVRVLYLAQAQILKRSPVAADRVLGSKIEAFVRGMPSPDTQRLALARALRAGRGPDRRQQEPKDRAR